MSHSVQLDPATGVVEVRLSGAITGSALREVTATAAALQRQSGALEFLVDINGWDVTASTVDIYNLADKQYWAEAIDRRSRIALLLPTSRSGVVAARFYETVCVNRGWNAQVCADRASAIDWLRAAHESPTDRHSTRGA